MANVQDKAIEIFSDFLDSDGFSKIIKDLTGEPLTIQKPNYKTIITDRFTKSIGHRKYDLNPRNKRWQTTSP